MFKTSHITEDGYNGRQATIDMNIFAAIAIEFQNIHTAIIHEDKEELLRAIDRMKDLFFRIAEEAS